jgi:hypothetical protein
LRVWVLALVVFHELLDILASLRVGGASEIVDVNILSWSLAELLGVVVVHIL